MQLIQVIKKLLAKVNWLVIAAAVFSCFIAFVNNFPLLFEDTGSYIRSGFEEHVAYERPVFYGLFIRYVSFASSLWYVVFAQGLLVCYMLYLTLGLFFEGDKKNIIFISSVVFLSITTGFSYNVSILIPDIFTAISVLCFVNLVLNPHLKKLQTVFLLLLFLLSVCMHFSSIPIIGGLFGVMLIYVLYRKLAKKPLNIFLKRSLLSFAVFMSSLIVIPTVHYYHDYNKQFRISGANHVFLMNHLVETGILEDYLANECGNHNWKICAYKDSIGWDFIWSPKSALQRTGGWEANRQEYKAIIKDIVVKPRFFTMICQKGVEFSLKQFFTFENKVSKPFLASGTSWMIELYYRPSLREFIASLQNQAKLDSTLINGVQLFVIVLSMGFLLVVLFTRRLFNVLDFKLKAALAIILTHNIINSVLCSNLSTIHPRFQNRIVWLLPLLCVIIIVKLVEAKKNRDRVTTQP